MLTLTSGLPPQSVFHVSYLRGLFTEKNFKGVDMENLEGVCPAARSGWQHHVSSNGASQRDARPSKRLPTCMGKLCCCRRHERQDAAAAHARVQAPGRLGGAG